MSSYQLIRDKEVRKILVIKLRAIGDVVLATAFLPNLRRAYGKAEIHFLVERSCQDVLIENPYIDRVIVLPRKEWETLPKISAFLKGLKFCEILKKEGYDLVFDLFGNPRSALLTFITRAYCRVGFNFRGRKYAYNIRVEPRGNLIHEVEFNLDALRALDIPIFDTFLYFPFSKNDREYVNMWIKKNELDKSFLIGIHSWGSWQAKCWELVKFAALADRLAETYQATIVLLWGPGEKEYAKKVQNLAHCSTIIAPETSLNELGALLARCRLLVANDSGPMHIAAAVGTPTVGIFGPTRWRLQGPYGKGHGVAYKKGLYCLGCNKISCKELSCMKELSVDEVVEVVQIVLKNRINK